MPFAGKSLLLALAVVLLGGCAEKRLGAPGQAPPLETMALTGEPMAVAQCAMTALQADGECDNFEWGLGVTRDEVTGAAKLTCYNVTPKAAAVGASLGIIGVLFGAAVDEKVPVGEGNRRPPLFTAVLKPVAPDAIEASFWVASRLEGPDGYLAAMKKALGHCEGTDPS